MPGFVVWSALFLGLLSSIISYLTIEVFKASPNYKLAIGILSARQNFIQRDAIRSTWLRALSNKKLSKQFRVHYSFILANKDCEVPLNYRKSEYSCEELEPWPENIEKSTLIFGGLKENYGITEYNAKYRMVAFDFTVLFDVVFSGVFLPVQRGNENHVQLWDLASDVLVLEARLGDAQYNAAKNVEVHPHLLPKGFVGSLIVTCGKNLPCLGIKNWIEHLAVPSAIEISPIVRFSTESSELPDHILPINLNEMSLPALMDLKIADVSKLQTHLEEKNNSYKTRQQEIEEINYKLKEEMQNHKDIIQLFDPDGMDLIEVYKNLPKKLVGFHHWCQENLNVDYVMKTDDDSYVDVEKIIQDLEHIEDLRLKQPSKVGIWLGRFRHDWTVDRWGKWAEYQYTANVYPAYACGAGNVLSSSVSEFFSKNQKHLRYYQGEDISAGIWLSSLDLEYIHNNLWQCDDTCSADMVLSTQHSPTSLEHLWQNKMNCGNPCGCGQPVG